MTRRLGLILAAVLGALLLVPAGAFASEEGGYITGQVFSVDGGMAI